MLPDFIDTTLLLGFFAGMLAGFVDSIAGGGGLITVPALLAFGLPPHQALATNKLQSSFGSATSTLSYASGGLIDFKKTGIAVLYTFIGAALGTLCIQLINTDFLKYLIPVLLVAIFSYVLLKPNWGKSASKAKLSNNVFFLIAGLTLGFYDGFFGPGTGSFWAASIVVFLGLDLKRATATTKLMNFTSNIVSFAFFAYAGLVNYSLGIVMGCGQVLGAFLGSKLVMRKGTRLVRIFLLCVTAATIARLVYQTYF
jgi:uncharacterized protein